MQRKRKFGIRDVIVLMIVISLIVGIAIQFFGGNSRQETITVNQFYERLDAEQISEITFSGQEGDGNINVLLAYGKYTEELINLREDGKDSFICYLNQQDY